MDTLKLLIADDVEENRTRLKEICLSMEGFEIREACDGIEAVEMADEWGPHIIIIDVMMPRLDGFQASKIIKERHPQTVIMALATVIDPNMEKNMASIGVSAYIHKPVDKELIRFKLQSFGALVRSNEGDFHPLSHKTALNLFNSDIRNFRTVFDITDIEGMMDFGMWILGRCEEKIAKSCGKADTALGLFYELMRHGTRDGHLLNIVVEESFEEMYATIKFEEIIDPKPKAMVLLNELGSECIIWGNTVCIRLRRMNEPKATAKEKIESVQKTSEPIIDKPIIVVREPEVIKEVRVIETNEKEMLRQSFVHKTAAIDYVQDIGGDVLDEIRDLESLDEEWTHKLHILEAEPTVENICLFSDGVLGVYVRAINNLFEFTALAYAISSLGSFLKENADAIINEPAKLKILVMLLEHLGSDLTSWREHIFGLQDTADIHYLDSSFFSSCMQIEGIIGNKEVSTDDDDDGMEFF
jgi:CheY-like chemotaxis protein